MSDEFNIIEFDDCERSKWINDIITYRNILDYNEQGDFYITILFSESIDINELRPMHIVSLACLIEYNHSLNYLVLIKSDNKEIEDFFYKKLRFREYFQGGQEYIESEDDKILNLWQVLDTWALSYSIKITDYLNQKYFIDHDMTNLKVPLDELYANIADHSESNGIAFSYISYNPESDKIQIAVCDFGLGIPYTLRRSDSIYNNDNEALRASIEKGVSAKTNERNRGFGLNTIVSSLSDQDRLVIVSNKAILNCANGINNITTEIIDIEFPGTLIYFEISTNSFPLKDFVDYDMELG